MKLMTLDEYKERLINFYIYEIDNNELKIKERKMLLSKIYSDNFLREVISGTYNFIEKILNITKDDYKGYIDIPLDDAPDIINISLNLSGGYPSDSIVKDTDGNYYSTKILKKIFPSSFIIDPYKTEYREEWDIDSNFEIMTEIPIYSLYIQCEESIINKVRESFFNNKVKKLEL